MTEAEWLSCNDPTPMMMEFLWGKVSERKHRLFAVACCRRIWQLLPHERSRRAIEVAERYADGQATVEELETASDAACAAWDADIERASADGTWDSDSRSPPLTASAAAYNVAIPLGWWGAAPAFVAPYEIARETTADGVVEGAAQCVLLRDILGNPFHPSPPITPAVLAWNDGTVLRIAQDIYEERRLPEGTLDNVRLGMLADALLDAGCEDEELIQHCRQPGPHVRGCWAVDLCLGKS